ncbi:glycoside hydrolase family 5 protein [Blautia sp. Sow4_E7]|uniref:glycoside hydrolase family 5 protein n=1 Tax=Blautia sp. Sow4_E7 TaxID=3438749 RepID=UPI003F91E8AE
MKQIIGSNLGNWLVLEKWMQEDIFKETDTEDEVWLNRKSDPEKLAKVMKQHRDTYVTEEDFKIIASHGINMVRIPVPYFIFGDVAPFCGCIEYLDKAFDWAEKYGLQILVDLHTVPDSQNGYDNGGITGVCKWCKQPEKVEFCLQILERLAKRYGSRKGLFGIEVLNEPISFPVYMTSPSRGKAADKEEAKGSGYVPMKFLKSFYLEAYERLRKILLEEKVICFHDGFRLTKWNRFFQKNQMKNVLLDTHIYIFAMEGFLPFKAMWLYKMYLAVEKMKIKKAQKQIPVVIGEWCICNKYAEKMAKSVMLEQEVETCRRERYLQVAGLELDTWKETAGYFYWNYQLVRDMENEIPESWKNSWDLRRCWKHGWIPDRLDK